MPHKLLNLQVFSDKEERFIARKLSGLLTQSHSQRTLNEELIEVQLVKELYSELIRQGHDSGLLPMVLKSDSEVVVYYSEVQSNKNYHNLFILPNGSLFITEVSIKSLT